jgi:membrane fusion protein, heavy metal efflux system
MKTINNIALSIVLNLFCLSALTAQEELALQTADIQRLGIVFMTVADVDNKTGASLPAVVINPPQAISTIQGLYAGVLQEWHVLPGTEVRIGDLLATVKSEEVLEIQKQWIVANSNAQQMAFELDKDRQLLQQGIISAQRVRETERDYQQADFTARSVTEQLVRAGFNDQQMQALLNATGVLGEYYVLASSQGSLAHQAVMAGMFFGENSEIGSINSSELWISAQIPARIGAELKIGQAISVPGVNSSLTLMQKDLEVNANTQTVEILASFAEPVDLLPGQVVSLIVPPVNNGVLIPADAVVHSGDETTVFVKTENGVEIRSLALVPVGSDYLARAGIVTGEIVVVRGTAILKGIQLGLGGE